MKISLKILLVVFFCLRNDGVFVMAKSFAAKDTLNDNKVEFLNNLPSRYPFKITISESIDPINNEVNLYFDGFVAMGPPPPPSSYKLGICIVMPDSLIISHRSQYNKKGLFEILEAYYDFANDPSNNFPRDELKINGLGKMLVPRIKFDIYINAGKKTTWELWRTYYTVLDNIYLLYDKKRNVIANDFYNSDFGLLSHVKKESIIKYRPMDITIIFNLKCAPVISTPIDEHEFFNIEMPGW